MKLYQYYKMYNDGTEKGLQVFCTAPNYKIAKKRLVSADNTLYSRVNIIPRDIKIKRTGEVYYTGLFERYIRNIKAYFKKNFRGYEWNI